MPGATGRHQANSAYQEPPLPLPGNVHPLAGNQPTPRRWKRLRTRGGEACLLVLALLPEVDGAPGPASGFDRLGVG